MSEKENKQVKSKQRVADHGEVYTAEREVNAMLDLVKQETERIDSTFLEPACGNGNFLAAILERKLDVVTRNYKHFVGDWEKYSVQAMMSIYGVDILEDNVEECRERLYLIWNDQYQQICRHECSDECRKAVKFILERNILCGDALTLLRSDGTPIIFSEWALMGKGLVKRRDYRLDVLMQDNKDPDNYLDNNMQLTMFGDAATDITNWMTDPLTGEPTPAPVAEFEPIYYREVYKHGA